MITLLPLVLSLAGPPAPTCDYGTSHALVVGVNRYGPGISPLRAARRDAERVAQALTARGFEVTALLDSQATRANIMRTLGDELLPGTRPADRVVLYFAGHGVTVGAGAHAMGYLIPADGHPARPVATGIAMRELTELLGTAPARHRWFLADACYAGLALPGSRRLVRADRAAPADAVRCAALAAPITSVLVAGREGQVAHEDGDGGVFTRTLLRGLAGQADADGDGWVSHLDLHAYVAQVVPRFTRRRWDRNQTPQGASQGDGAFMLRALPDAEATTPMPKATAGALRRVKGVEVVEIPAGPFQMGCDPQRQPGCPAAEQPRRVVTLPAYGITRTEITVRAYRRCQQADACTGLDPDQPWPECNANRFDGAAHPMNCVTWAQAQAYCQWLGGGLCPATHWEKAARGPAGHPYPWGTEPAGCERAHLNQGGQGCGTLRTAPVGSKPAGRSPYGAVDMAGNVAEFVADTITEGHGQDARVGYRGGSYVDGPEALRCSAVNDQLPRLTGTAFGIRCCLPPP